MSYSLTTAESTTFTLTDAKYIAAKVATDLKRMQRFYEYPSDSDINDYEAELTQLLKHGYVKKVSYGFKKDGEFIEPTLIYTAAELSISDNDDPGKVKPNKNVAGASFYSFLEYTPAWSSLSSDQKEKFKNQLPFKRGSAETPGINGYLESDKTYSSGGRALSRSSVRSFQ